MDPLELLPPEMWAEVFVRVQEAADWHNLYNASPSFRNVAKSQRATELFPLVLPHFIEYLFKDKDLKVIIRLLMSVSQKWSQGVMSLLERKMKDARAVFMKEPMRTKLPRDFWSGNFRP